MAVGAIEVTIHEATFWGLGAQVGCYLYVAVTKKNDMSGFGKKAEWWSLATCLDVIKH